MTDRHLRPQIRQISSSPDELLQSRLVVKAGGDESLVNLLTGEAHLRHLLEGPQVFPAGFLLGVMERRHVLAGLHTEALVNQSGNLKYYYYRSEASEASPPPTYQQRDKNLSVSDCPDPQIYSQWPGG